MSLIDDIRNYLNQLSPHVSSREAAQLLKRAEFKIRDLENHGLDDLIEKYLDTLEEKDTADNVLCNFYNWVQENKTSN